MGEAATSLQPLCEVKLERLERVAADTYLLVTERPFIAYEAGQHARIWVSETEWRSFSIASAPIDPDRLQFFIGGVAASSFVQQLLERATRTRRINISLPYGAAKLTCGSGDPLLLIAGGTGYAFTRSVLAMDLHRQRPAPVRLLWGVRSADRLFDIPHLQALSDRHPRFAWETWIEKPGSEGAGHVGDIVDAISSLDWDAAEIAAAQVFIGGRREMATAARAALVCRGFSSHHMFSD